MDRADLAQKIIEKHQLNYTADKKVVYIFKGVHPELNNRQKIFDISMDAPLSMLLESIKDPLAHIMDMINSEYKWFWALAEETINLSNIMKSQFYFVVIDNNLFYNLYPIERSISNLESIFESRLPEDDLSDRDVTNSEIQMFFQVYGGIEYNNLDDQYYIAYQDLSIIPDEFINLYSEANLENISEIEMNNYDYEFELTNEEDQILEFISRAMKLPIEKEWNVNIVVADNPEQLGNNINTRVKLLNKLFPKIKIAYSPKKMTYKPIKHSKKYHELLNDFWGYKSFKNIPIYRDVQRSSKTLNISQEQIINDLVEQAEIAINGNTPRDIFVTAATGSGKSLMFQLPALYLAEMYREDKPLTIVISPLIGLMDDQVRSLTNKNISTSRTIHSNVSPNKKEKIIQEIKNCEVDILYISTETLQNKYDIKMLIGDRKIGLFIVDEAHIVTTWGKSFRADYWYMGLYLQKLRKEYNFPIATFTATAIYGGRDDMYSDTIESLKLANPISYFGYVIRDDITMCIDSSEKPFESTGGDYRYIKHQLIIDQLMKFVERNEKVLVYFPTVKLIRDLYHQADNIELLNGKVVKYYGSLDATEKELAYRSFMNGESSIMFATKAFGMGIDIPDIVHVLHYAPTGSITDYIQEIGRAARGLDHGYAWFDYLSADLNHIKRLHGMSRITVSQIKEVMRKIVDIYTQKNNRNLVISADDFQYLVQHNVDDDQNIDNKIKIILLMIEKDFEKRIGYSPFYARPKQMFGNELIFVKEEELALFEKRGIMKYLNRVDTLEESFYSYVYEFKMKDFWEAYYPKMSFGKFKYGIFQKENKILAQHRDVFDKLIFCTGISYILEDKLIQVKMKFEQFMVQIDNIFRSFYIKNKHFSIENLSCELIKETKMESLKTKSLASVFISTVLQLGREKNLKVLYERPHGLETKYQITKDYYVGLRMIQDTFNNLLFKPKNKGLRYTDKVIQYRYRTFGQSYQDNFELELSLLGLLESLDLLNYNVLNGNNPQIYIRINSISPIKKVLDDTKYRNKLLDEVYYKQKVSLELFDYLFKLPKLGNTKQERVYNYTEEFWKIIENYFRGKLPDEVEERLYKRIN